MRVVTWNMGLNDPRFKQPGIHEQAWHYLLGLGPDLAFVQECRPPAWVSTEGQLVSQAFQKWGSVLFSSRFPLQPVPIPDDSPLRALGEYVAVARASLFDGTEAFVASVHARANEATPRQLGDVDPGTIARSSVGHANVNDLILFALTSLVGRRFIAAGDWNTGRAQASATAGVEFFERVQQTGWHDAAWEVNKHEETQTWFGPHSKLIQDDHVFCDPGLGEHVRKGWAASDAPKHLGLSDHAPLVIDIEMESIAMTNLREGGHDAVASSRRGSSS